MKNKLLGCFAFLTLIVLSHDASALDLEKLMKKINDNQQKNAQQPNSAQPSINSNANNTSSSTNGSTSSNKFQSQNDPARESVKKQRTILAAKRDGVPVDVKELVDGQEYVTKDEVLIQALTKAVRTVHSDLGLPSYQYPRTYSELQKNITSPAYSLINKFDKIEKENVYMMMNQPDPSRNTWSVTVNASVNTKLTSEVLQKIKNDQRIIYTQSFGQNAAEARQGAILIAVQQYHQISIAPNTPFVRNLSTNSNYGVIQKVDVISEELNPYNKMVLSKVKVTLADMATVDQAKFASIKNDIDVSKVKESPNPVLIALSAATREVGEAQTIIEGALNIKGENEIKKQDAYREKAGVRFGENDFQAQVGMNADRWAVIDERLKDNPKLDEQQKQEFQRGQKAMVPAFTKVIKAGASIFSSISSGGNPFQSLQALIAFPKLMASNSDGVNSLMTYNTNNGIDNKEMDLAKKDMGE
jgi:hypothetical protein